MQRCCPKEHYSSSEEFGIRTITLKNTRAMSKSLDAKKEAKKEPTKSLKEKRLEKKAKKDKNKA